MGLLSKVILITGVTGWLGKSFINIADNSEKNYNLLGLSSRTQSQDVFDKLKSHNKVLTENFWNFTNPSGEVEGIVHLAFLTRDKLKGKSRSEYLAENQKITERACALVLSYKPKWVLTVSSGATENFDESNYYGQLKREEENALTNVCQSTGSGLLIGRLWGATGFSMPINRNYAISDFICQAFETGTIGVNSNFEVWRRYVDAEQFMDLLFKRALAGDSGIINSGGPIIEIGELAKKIALSMGVTKQIVRNFESDSDLIDNYFFPGDEYELSLDKFGISTKSIDEQISDTILGHKFQIQAKEG